ncbi:sterol desaturase family protein [Croceimicrobium hydrocarbonivorans]|nr:sterol desaturase family protein [Croceimicrobium hydrocarbonivorans]
MLSKPALSWEPDCRICIWDACNSYFWEMDIQFPNLIHHAIPFFVAFVLLEIVLTAWRRIPTYQAKDALSSIAMGLGNVGVGFISKALIFGAYTLVYQFRIFTLDFSWWMWILLFLGDDLSYYWFHRTSHNVRYFWASHIVHHSSQNYNLATALRQTWTGGLTGSFIFYLWLPLLGFHPLAILFMHSISLLYQFWIHTELIDRMPRWFEYIFNTPSHHRVHHSSDTKYLDRNHAGILIIWDRMFGTFIEEDEHPHYGLTKNIHSFNPLYIATHEWIAIFQDIRKHPKYFWSYLFGPPGWSHDGSRKTSAQLRAEMQDSE